MKKVEMILKKAAFFEKLSLYGDQKDFLKALAQDPREFLESLHNLIQENYLDKIFVPGEGLAGCYTDVYICLLNNCGLVIKERLGTSVGSFADFAISNEKSLAKVVETKRIIEEKTNLKLKGIKYSI